MGRERHRAVERGAVVYPYRWKDESAAEFAASVEAELAESRETTRYSLSPVALRSISDGERIVLPSPNGATLTLLAAEHASQVMAGSLRNASAVAGRAPADGVVSVIAAGEKWKDDGDLRPCFEDMLGAGAILSHLPASDLSPEALSAVAVFEAARPHLEARLVQCGSGQELIAIGFGADVVMAAELDASPVCPTLRDGAYVNA